MNENEQDLIIKKKIEKREKLDIALAFIMIAVLLACIIFVLYLKFIRKEDDNHDSNNNILAKITLNNINSSLENSSVVQEFKNDGAAISSSINGNNLNVTYTKESTTFTMNMTLAGDELAVAIDKNNEEISQKIYQEVATTICSYYGNTRNDCIRTIESAKENPVDGIRYTTFNDIETIYIDITKKINVNTPPTYNHKTIESLSNTNYILSMNDTRIDHINIMNDSTSIKVSGNIYNLGNKEATLDVILTLYNENNEELKEEKYSFTESNKLTSSNSFTITIDLDDKIAIGTIKKYSLEIVK